MWFIYVKRISIELSSIDAILEITESQNQVCVWYSWHCLTSSTWIESGNFDFFLFRLVFFFCCFVFVSHLVYQLIVSESVCASLWHVQRDIIDVSTPNKTHQSQLLLISIPLNSQFNYFYVWSFDWFVECITIKLNHQN